MSVIDSFCCNRSFFASFDVTPSLDMGGEEEEGAREKEREREISCQCKLQEDLKDDAHCYVSHRCFLFVLCPLPNEKLLFSFV